MTVFLECPWVKRGKHEQHGLSRHLVKVPLGRIRRNWRKNEGKRTRKEQKRTEKSSRSAPSKESKKLGKNQRKKKEKKTE